MNKGETNIVDPITQKRAKQLEKEIYSQMNTNLILINQNISDHAVLSSSCFNVLKNDVLYARAWDDDGYFPPVL